MMTDGTVKFFNMAKNFGFISADDGKEYFVHGSGLKDGVNVKEGDKVSFDIVDAERGPKAENVKLNK